MTELAYLSDSDAAYERTFRAKVTGLPPGAVVLDRTFFYPVGGGQPADRGTLTLDDGGVVPIVDVSKSGPAVLHRVGRRGAPPGRPRVGEEVVGAIDWDRRYRHMRLHSLQHLLSARLFERTGRRTRLARLEANAGFIDLEPPWPGSESAATIGEDARAYIARGLAVRIAHIPREDYERTPGARSGLVPLPPHVDPVRVVEIETADRCPCGGTHVRSTAELGEFTLDPPTPTPSGDVRVSFRLAETVPPTPSG